MNIDIGKINDSIRRMIARLAATLCWLIALHFAFAAVSRAHADDSVEYQVKSSLVFNFLKFIEWPNGESLDQFILCHFPDSVYQQPLSQLQGEIVQGKLLNIEQVTLENVNRCDIAVMTRAEANLIEEIGAMGPEKTLLTIGESEDFLDLGGVIRFTIVDNTVQFEINQARAKQMRLTISSKLLRLAQHVEQ